MNVLDTRGFWVCIVVRATVSVRVSVRVCIVVVVRATVTVRVSVRV